MFYIKKDLINDLLLYPCPVVLVTSKNNDIENVLTVSWAGIASSHPEYIAISIKTNRLSHGLILCSRAFTVNIPNDSLLKKVDYCGTFSGRDTNKFDDCGFTRLSGKQICVSMIEECPVNIECMVYQTIELGSHTLIIGKVVGKYIDENIYINELHKALNPVVYFRPHYYNINKVSLGLYGQMNSPKNNELIKII